MELNWQDLHANSLQSGPFVACFQSLLQWTLHGCLKMKVGKNFAALWERHTPSAMLGAKWSEFSKQTTSSSGEIPRCFREGYLDVPLEASKKMVN